jgi:xanthine dehydrogenase YagS FAD-binding subunit
MVKAADYFTMPTKENVQRENVLEPDELLTHVILPAPGSVKSGHYEVRYKTSHDWPIAFATVLLTMNGSTVQGARVVMGAVAPVPWRSQAAEKALAGKADYARDRRRRRRGGADRRGTAEPERL